MSDIMKPMPFAQLMDWALTEYRERGSIFGVRRMPHFKKGSGINFYDERIEMPFGPAAGPNTQLAQNIVAGYVAGGRFFELKTVQVMDGAEMTACIPKPCIAPGDVCYNCEWSTELTCEQALGEYVKAWYACKLLSRELDLGADDGFIFNMSVGYDLKGIQSPKVDAFIEGMKDASSTDVWRECSTWARGHLDRFDKVDEEFIDSISSRVSRSVTLSTMHGCPADEIEGIVDYLLEEKGLYTCVKLNPTLTGYEFVRGRLDALGYGALSLDPESFEKDLQWEAARGMIARLIDRARSCGLEFGVKVSNTLPVNVLFHELPADQMYMSGVALFPLAIAVVRKVAEEFDGKIHISFSAGADERNIKALHEAGIWPVTIATSLLRPCGYDRFGRMAKAIGGTMDPSDQPVVRRVDVEKVVELDRDAVEGDLYRRPEHAQAKRQLSAQLPLLDCLACRVCETVCPNRANVTIDVPGFKRRQVLHIDGMCNECGNCAVFCPYEGRPYKNKLTVFWSKEDMEASDNDGFLLLQNGSFLVRYKGETKMVDVDAPEGELPIPVDLAQVIAAARDGYPYLLGA